MTDSTKVDSNYGVAITSPLHMSHFGPLSTYEKVSDQGPVWVRSEDKIPGAFISTHDINVWLPEFSLVP